MQICTIIDYISVEKKYIFSSWLSIMKIGFLHVYFKKIKCGYLIKKDKNILLNEYISYELSIDNIDL